MREKTPNAHMVLAFNRLSSGWLTDVSPASTKAVKQLRFMEEIFEAWMPR